MTLPSSQLEAKKLKVPLFWDGKPCSEGHVAAKSAKTLLCHRCATNILMAKRKARYEKDSTYKEMMKEKARKYRASHKQQVKEYNKEYAADHAERIKEYKRNHHAANPHFVRDTNIQRVRMMGVSKLSKMFRKEIADFYTNRPPGMTVDHQHPLRGITRDGYRFCGLHVPWNLEYMPRRENTSKGNRVDF